jgi:D-alanine-D-alanine ligase
MIAEGRGADLAKLRVGLLFGGRSVEHDVSITSATSILQALDPDRYEVSLIGVGEDGRWHLGSGAALLPSECIKGQEVTLPASPRESTILAMVEGAAEAADAKEGLALDVIFPIIHGRGGEDGALQGLFELADVAYVGSGVLSSAMQMDKDIAKRLLMAAGIPVLPWVTLQSYALDGDGMQQAVDSVIGELGLPLFVKPANSGSSVGISNANDAALLKDALIEAAQYDSKILIERAVDAREVEVAVLGNEAPEASVPGEIVPTHEFYDYEAKYHDDSTQLVVPADLDEATTQQLRDMAIQAFSTLDGAGMARVDFLIERESGAIWVNELNSLPGFTDVSMYPRLWEASGLPYDALLDRLIELALDRHRQRQKLETRYRRPGR